MTLYADDHVRPAEHGTDWLALPVAPAAAGLARRFVTRCLTSADPDVVDVLVLLTSELVANAVLHGLAPIRLQLHQQSGILRVEVRDAGRPFTARAVAAWSPTEESGRGLPLLDALATSWGSHTTPHVTGKTLWFELAYDRPDSPHQDRAHQDAARSRRPT